MLTVNDKSRDNNNNNNNNNNSIIQVYSRVDSTARGPITETAQNIYYIKE
jgi:hypothetical protein